MRILIDHVTVLTMDAQNTVLNNGYVLTDGAAIGKVGQGECPSDFDLHIDGRGGILMPGMINTHCHVPMIPFRTLGDDCPDRLRLFLFPLEQEAMTKELVYLSALYGIGELLLSGITTFLDMYYFEEEVARACETLGIRGYLGETVISGPTCDACTEEESLAYSEAFLDRWRDSPLVTPILASHAVNTTSLRAMKKAHELAGRYGTLHTLHLSEMDYELSYIRDQYGMTPTEYLWENGLLDARTTAAHCIHMTDRDLDLLASSGAGVSHCIGANTKAGKGVARIKEMNELGIPVGFGTDGPSSGNTLDLFSQFRLFACFQKTWYRDRRLFPADQIVEFGTMGGARLLGAAGRLGSIEPEKLADLVLVETASANMFPCFNPSSALVYSARASNVDTVLVDGQVVVRDKRLTCASLEELRSGLADEMGGFYEAALNYPEAL